MKKIISLALALVIGAMSANAQIVKGDMNDDKIIDVSDLNESIDVMGGRKPYQYIQAGDPSTVDNSLVTGTWYKTRTDFITLNADGTTDYSGASSYKFFPYQGALMFYDAQGKVVGEITVDMLKEGYMVCVPKSTGVLTVLTTTRPAQLVTSIRLLNTSIKMCPGEFWVLIATVLPTTADNKTLTFESSDNKVVRTEGRKIFAVAFGTATITCRATDGSGVTATCEVTVEPRDLSGTDSNGREYVDLGLPSLTRWATCNVGSDTPENTGMRFAWGDTVGYTGGHAFNEANYVHCNGSGSLLTKYCNDINYWDTSTGLPMDNKLELDPEDDAAYAKWGSNWRMPTLAQVEELENSQYTKIELATLNGKYVNKITSRINGRCIYIPVDNYYDYKLGSYRCFEVWTRTLWRRDDPTRAYVFESAYDAGWDMMILRDVIDARWYGYNIRPVYVGD